MSRLPLASCGAVIDHGKLLLHMSSDAICRAESSRIVNGRWRITARNLTGVGSMIDDADQFKGMTK